MLQAIHRSPKAYICGMFECNLSLIRMVIKHLNIVLAILFFIYFDQTTKLKP